MSSFAATLQLMNSDAKGKVGLKEEATMREAGLTSDDIVYLQEEMSGTTQPQIRAERLAVRGIGSDAVAADPSKVLPKEAEDMGYKVVETATDFEDEAIDFYKFLRSYETRGLNEDESWIRTKGAEGNSAAYGPLQISAKLADVVQLSGTDPNTGKSWAAPTRARLIADNPELQAFVKDMARQRELMLRYGNGDWKNIVKAPYTDETPVDTFRGKVVTVGHIKNNLEYGKSGLMNSQEDRVLYNELSLILLQDMLKRHNGNYLEATKEWKGNVDRTIIPYQSMKKTK